MNKVKPKMLEKLEKLKTYLPGSLFTQGIDVGGQDKLGPFGIAVLEGSVGDDLLISGRHCAFGKSLGWSED